jgi:glutaredoxin
VKEFLSQENVAFMERDIAADPAALAELEKLGYRTTPVTLVDSEVVVGFEPEKLAELLSLA